MPASQTDWLLWFGWWVWHHPLQRSWELQMSQMDFSKRGGRYSRLSGVLLKVSHYFYSSNTGYLKAGWAGGIVRHITPTTQLNSLGLLLSQTPGEVGEICCHTWLQTLSGLPPHFALLSFPLGIYWVLAAGPVLSWEEANYLLSEVCHHVCYLFETLKCRCFLTPLQGIIDTPRAGLNCFSKVHHGAIPSQCILMETLTFPNLCWTEWSWGRVTHRFLRFGLCMVPQRSCTSRLRDFKKKVFRVISFSTLSSNPQNCLPCVHFADKAFHRASYLIYWFFSFHFQFDFSLDFL